MKTSNVTHVPPLYGLVLAGGYGLRMGRDKGALDYHGEPQVAWCLKLLAPVCERCFASVRAEQTHEPTYLNLPLIVDEAPGVGPAAGLAAAGAQLPGVAWLVIGADMPLLDERVLMALVAQRDPHRAGTAYVHPDGTPEPLCAIFEPRAVARLQSAGLANLSLRGLLEGGAAKLLPAPDDRVLRSANTPEHDAEIRRVLAARAAGGPCLS